MPNDNTNNSNHLIESINFTSRRSNSGYDIVANFSPSSTDDNQEEVVFDTESAAHLDENTYIDVDHEYGYVVGYSSERGYVRIGYSGQQDTLIPVRYYDEEENEGQTHWTSTYAMVRQENTDENRMQLMYNNLFEDSGFETQDRYDALQRLAQNVNPENVEEELREEVRELRDELIEEGYRNQGAEDEELYDELNTRAGNYLSIEHEEAEITEIDLDNGTATVQWNGELDDVIPLRYRSVSGDEQSIERHWIPTSIPVIDSDGVSIMYQRIFEEESESTPQSREDALRGLAEDRNPEQVYEHIRREVRELRDEFLSETAANLMEDSVEGEEPVDEEPDDEEIVMEDSEETGSASISMEWSDTVTEQTDITRDDVVEAAENSTSERDIGVSEETTSEDITRDMDGRYDYEQDEEQRLREMATEIETRIDHLLSKRQRIKEKLEEMQEDE